MIQIIFTLLLLPYLAFGLDPKTDAKYTPGFYSLKNYIKNPNCGDNILNLTSSTGSGISRQTTTPLVSGAKANCRFNPGASGATVKIDINSLDPAISSGNCEARFTTEATTSADWVAYLEYDSSQVTSDLAVNVTSGTQEFSISYPCSSGTTTRKLVFESQTTPGALEFGAMYFGKATNLSSVTGPATSVSGEVTVFDGTTGKKVARASGSGFAKLTSGVLSAQTSVVLSTDVTGVLDETNGGTGQSSYSAGDILYASGANTLAVLAKTTDGNVLTLASGLPSWASAPAPALTVRTINGNDTLANSDDLILLDASSAGFTFTLHDPSTATKKRYTLVVNTSSTNQITLGGYNLNGASRKMQTQYETLVIIPNGSTWTVVDHKTNTDKNPYTPTSSFTTNTTPAGYWWREAGFMYGQVVLNFAGAPNATNGNATLPSGYTMDTGRMISSSSFAGSFESKGSGLIGGNAKLFFGTYSSSTTISFRFVSNDQGQTSPVSATSMGTIGAGDELSLVFRVPITDWW